MARLLLNGEKLRHDIKCDARDSPCVRSEPQMLRILVLVPLLVLVTVRTSIITRTRILNIKTVGQAFHPKGYLV